MRRGAANAVICHFKQKYRPPLSNFEIAQLNALAALDFSTYNETDVREIYIRPLLTLLGDQKDRDYSVSTVESFKLAEPFLRIGRESIQLDYLIAVRKQNFLVDRSEKRERWPKWNDP